MKKYFCENLVLNKEALRMAYICKKTNKLSFIYDEKTRNIEVKYKFYNLIREFGIF